MKVTLTQKCERLLLGLYLIGATISVLIMFYVLIRRWMVR